MNKVDNIINTKGFQYSLKNEQKKFSLVLNNFKIDRNVSYEQMNFTMKISLWQMLRNSVPKTYGFENFYAFNTQCDYGFRKSFDYSRFMENLQNLQDFFLAIYLIAKIF